MSDTAIDSYTLRHLDTWLNEQIHGDALRDKIRTHMIRFIADDPAYWGAQSWWLVYDRADCGRIEAVQS